MECRCPRITDWRTKNSQTWTRTTDDAAGEKIRGMVYTYKKDGESLLALIKRAALVPRTEKSQRADSKNAPTIEIRRYPTNLLGMEVICRESRVTPEGLPKIAKYSARGSGNRSKAHRSRTRVTGCFMMRSRWSPHVITKPLWLFA
jgi:hypothetical protein